MQGCEAVCSLAEVGPGQGLLTQFWMLLLGALTGKASVGGVRGREMDKRTSWGLLGHQPYLILDLHGTIMAALLIDAWLASILDCEALGYVGVTAPHFHILECWEERF